MEEGNAVKNFKQFDMVTDYSDHHYRDRKNMGSFDNASACVRKKIMEEWNILEENLPEAIFVRAYEERIDLLRAVIIGAEGTPYHDGLFFLDMAFPSDYPNRPPMVYYHSHGLRLNPNLYDNGYVCLSLLNTWSGQGDERWVPSKSTILQVLVSIQGLVLNAEPYYNEPGHGRSPVSDSQSRSYNEITFTLSCRTMLFCLKNPPKNFEGFVSKYFRENANRILRACKDYMEDRAIVGHFQDNGSSSSGINVSRNFKESMTNIYNDLEAEFGKNGITEPKQPEPKGKDLDEVAEGKRSQGKRKATDSLKTKKTEVKHEYLTRSKTTAAKKFNV